MKRNETLEMLHTAFNNLAPDQAAQNHITKARQDMEEAGESPRQIALMMASSLVDGLNFGNW